MYFCLTLARFSLAAWVGAAGLFVVTGVDEVRSPEFDSATKSALAALRFPSYYAFGFVLVSLGLAGGLAARFFAVRVDAAQVESAPKCRFPSRLCLALTAAALALMTVDYLWIYSPLEAMMLTPHDARPAHFQTVHRASIGINMVHFGLSLVAAWLICRPRTA